MDVKHFLQHFNNIMISLLLILSFYHSVLLRTIIYVKQRLGGPGRVEPCKESWSTLIIFKTSHLFDLFFLQYIILIQWLFYYNTYTCNKFYATALKVIFTLFTNFLQIFIFMILQHDTKSQVV